MLQTIGERSIDGNVEEVETAMSDDRGAKVRAMFALLDRAAADTRLTGTQFRMLYVFTQRENQRLSQATLGGLVGGIKARMQRIATRWLESCGYISVDRGCGPGFASRYRVQYRQPIAGIQLRDAATDCRDRGKCGNPLPRSGNESRQSVARNAAIDCQNPGNGLPPEVLKKRTVKKKSSARADARPPQATRWPDDAVVSDDWITKAEQARQAHGLAEIDLKLEADKFANYWASKSGAQASKKDWLRTWINWALTARMTRTTHGKSSVSNTLTHLADIAAGRERRPSQIEQLAAIIEQERQLAGFADGPVIDG